MFRETDISASSDSLQLSQEEKAKIEYLFCQQVLQNTQGMIDIAISHKTLLKTFKSTWKDLRSNTICLACMARKPEKSFDCHHSICETCTIIHGQASLDEPWIFTFNTCLLCEAPNQTRFFIKPYTAGIRCLSIEGGGVRGMLPLGFLIRLQNYLRLIMPVQEHFDISVGTSSGLSLEANVLNL
jgi:hypothetical protein